MGLLANIGTPQIYGLNCTFEEWQVAVRLGISGVLQDEEEWGRAIDSWWGELRRQFPQISVREFVDACGPLAKPATEIPR